MHSLPVSYRHYQRPCTASSVTDWEPTAVRLPLSYWLTVPSTCELRALLHDCRLISPVSFVSDDSLLPDGWFQRPEASCRLASLIHGFDSASIAMSSLKPESVDSDSGSVDSLPHYCHGHGVYRTSGTSIHEYEAASLRPCSRSLRDYTASTTGTNSRLP